MQLQIRLLNMIRIFIVHLDTFLSIPAALQGTNKQLHVIVWLPRAGFCTENKKHDVEAPLTGRPGFNGPVAGVVGRVQCTGDKIRIFFRIYL